MKTKMLYMSVMRDGTTSLWDSPEERRNGAVEGERYVDLEVTANTLVPMPANHIAVNDVDVTDYLKASADAQKLFNIEIALLETNGPGGGNPTVRLQGPMENIDRCLRFWGYEDEVIRELLQEAE